MKRNSQSVEKCFVNSIQHELNRCLHKAGDDFVVHPVCLLVLHIQIEILLIC